MKRMRVILYGCCLCILFACSKEEPAKEVGVPTEITLGVRADQSRAAVSNLVDLARIGDRIGIYGITDWAEPAVMHNVRTTAVSAQTGTLDWEDTYYYPYHRPIRFYSYYPYASTDTIDGCFMEEPAGVAPILHFTITGEEDLMYADPVWGSGEKMPAPLAYNHLLTQFHFVLIDEGDFHETTIERITFTGVNTSSTLHLADGTLGDWSVPCDLLFPTSYPLQIKGTAELPQAISGSLMLQPGLKQFSLEIVVADKGTFSDVVIIPWDEPRFVAGRSYEITLKFNKRDDGGDPGDGDGDGDGGDPGDGGEIGVEIKASAWVTPWKEGGNGSGQIGEE